MTIFQVEYVNDARSLVTYSGPSLARARERLGAVTTGALYICTIPHDTSSRMRRELLEGRGIYSVDPRSIP